LRHRGRTATNAHNILCTAAGVQIVRNIVERDNDHSTSGQRRYFDIDEPPTTPEKKP
jgi:hypothetical protein